MSANVDYGCWYALRTYFSQELKLSYFLTKHGIEHFVPMVDRSYYTAEGLFVKDIHPIVHNLLFVRKTLPKAQLRAILRSSPYPVRVYHRIASEDDWCEISDQELMDLRLLCDTSVCHPDYITQRESELAVGTEVRVTCGPLKDITGKLVRKHKKYYLIKTFVGLGMQVSVSRWCCEKI